MRASQLTSILVASIAVTFVTACNRTSGDAPAPPSSSASSPSSAPSSAPSAAPAAAASSSTDAGAALTSSAKAARCPTLVAGSSATVADTADGVALTVTAKDPAAVAEIRARAHGIDDWVKQSAARRAASGGGGGGGDGRQGGQGGDGNGAGDGVGGGGGAGGGGGGGMGKCPVVTRFTTVDVKDSPTGAVVTMRPLSDRDLTGLRRQVRERLAGD
jgi:hypothetical protein